MTEAPVTDLDLAEVERMLAGITPGPWEVGGDGNGAAGFVYCHNELGSAVAIFAGPALRWTVFPRAEEEANGRLIAAAPTIIRSLLSALKAERERTGKMEAVLRAYEQWDADVILTNECWRNAMPTLTQELYDHWIEIAEQRNAALGDRT